MTATPTVTATPVATAALNPGEPKDFALGQLVQVYGTEGEGLRLRSEPGLEATILFLGLEHEVFRVEEGPVERDGYQWWYLVNPYDESKRGWAVSAFLRSAEEP